MICPRLACNSEDTYVTKTASHNSAALKSYLRGMNVVRRIRRCATCQTLFPTIELLEEELNKIAIRDPERREGAR